MSKNYAIDDGNGNQITAGLQEHDARQVAQQIADERGESVWLYEIGLGDDRDDEEPESEEIVPQVSEAASDNAPCGYRVYRGADVNQVRADGSALHPHTWYYEPIDYEGDVVFDQQGYATREEAETAARRYDARRCE